jgi:hypothetical protein
MHFRKFALRMSCECPIACEILVIALFLVVGDN